MKTFTYETLITCDPFYHCDVIAGWDYRKNACQHVSIDDFPKKENSLVFIEDTDLTDSTFKALLENNYTSGIVIVANKTFDVPSSFLEWARMKKKPILSLKNHPIEKLGKRVQELLHLHDLQVLPLLKNDLTTYWLQLFHQQGIEDVLKKFTNFFGQEIALFSKQKKYIPLLSNKFTEKELIRMEKNENIENIDHLKLQVVKHDEQLFYFYHLNGEDGQTIGYLLFEKSVPPEELPFSLLETIEPTIVTWFKQMEITRTIHQLYKDQFIFDILHNNIDTETELKELGQLRNMEFTPNAFVVAIDFESYQTITNETVSTIQQLLTEQDFIEAKIFSTYLNDLIVAIVCPLHWNEKIPKNDVDQWILQVRERIRTHDPNLETRIGIGRSYASNLDIYKSFQEAKIALQMEIYHRNSNGIIYYEDLGFVRLLSYIHHDLLRDFSNQYLGELIQYDRDNQTELVHTLSIYCAQNGDISSTAEELFIHQNTLRQRLKKIESILNVDLNQYTTLVNLILSLQILLETDE